MKTLKHTTSKGMMKAVACAAFFILHSSLLTSCNSFLTDEPKSQITPEEAYNSVKNLKLNALLTIYNYIGGHEQSQGLQGTDRGVYDLNSFTTDEQIVPTRGGDWFDGGLWSRLFFHTWSAGEAPLKNTWDYLYKVVILCNEGIEHINAYKTTNVEEQEELESYKAELRAVRAMFYFYLMDLYGRVPLVTQTGVKSNEMTLADRKTLFFWIYNELNEAMPYLSDEKSNRPNTEYYGRVTATVAYFLMMKLAINAEVYTDNDWIDQQRPDGRQIILKTYDFRDGEIIEANAWQTVKEISYLLYPYYKLAEYYPDNFDVNNENSPENIFVIPMNPLLYSNKYNYFFRSRHYCHGAALNGGAENGPCATVSTIKAFGYGKDDYDIRLTFNFYYDEVIVNGHQVYEDDGKTPLVYHPLAVTDIDLSGEPFEKTAGARIAKYSVDATARDDGRLGNNDIVLFRFADVVLMYAEACYRLGETEDALKALNSVFTRSNHDARPSYKEVNDDILLQERLLEFMWEGWRRNDLIRFDRFHKPYDLKNSSEHEADRHTIVFPIPADMMVMHPDWEQNPGY